MLYLSYVRICAEFEPIFEKVVRFKENKWNKMWFEVFGSLKGNTYRLNQAAGNTDGCVLELLSLMWFQLSRI